MRDSWFYGHFKKDSFSDEDLNRASAIQQFYENSRSVLTHFNN